MKQLIAALLIASASSVAVAGGVCLTTDLKSHDEMLRSFRAKDYRDFLMRYHDLCMTYEDLILCREETVNTADVESRTRTITSFDRCAEAIVIDGGRVSTIYFTTNKLIACSK